MQVSKITVNNQGHGYVRPPTVKIEGGGGTGAAAHVSVLTSGCIGAVEVDEPGQNYTSPPTVTFINNEDYGGGATATAEIADTPGTSEAERRGAIPPDNIHRTQ